MQNFCKNLLSHFLIKFITLIHPPSMKVLYVTLLNSFLIEKPFLITSTNVTKKGISSLFLLTYIAENTLVIKRVHCTFAKKGLKSTGIYQNSIIKVPNAKNFNQLNSIILFSEKSLGRKDIMIFTFRI